MCTAVLPHVVLALVLCAPLMVHPGIPGFVHDWIWPLWRSEKLWTWQELISAWNANGIGRPNSVMTVNPLHWLQLGLAALLPMKTALLVYVVGALSATSMAVYRIAREHLELAQWPAFLAGAFTVSSGALFSKIAAGQIGYLAATAAFGWGLLMLLRLQSRPCAKWAFATAAVFALCSIQLQILFFALIVCALSAVVYRPAYANIPYLAVACVGALALAFPELLSLAHYGPTVGASVPIPHMSWEIAQSSSNADASALMGYAARYTERALALWPLAISLERIVTTALCIALVPVLVLYSRRRRTGVFFAVMGILGFLWITGVKGVAAPLWIALFRTTVYVDFLREFFHAAILLTIPLGLTLAIAVHNISRSWRRTGLLAGGIALLCAGLAFFTGGLWRVLPYVKIPSYSAEVARTVSSLPAGPVLFTPTQHDLYVSGDSVGGNDLFDWVDSRHLSLYSYLLPPMVRLLDAQIEAGNPAVFRLADRLGVSAIVIRSDVESRPWHPNAPIVFKHSAEYARWLPYAREHRSELAPGALIFRLAHAPELSAAASASALPPDLHALLFAPVSHVFVDLPGTNITALDQHVLASADPSTGWLPYRDATNALRGGLWLAGPALVTDASGQTTRFWAPDDTTLLVWAPDGLRLNSSIVRSRTVAEVPVRRGPIVATSFGAAALGELGRQKVEPPPLQHCVVNGSRTLPWTYSGTVRAHGTCLLVLRTAYAPTWRLYAPGMEVLQHVRTDGFGNGWFVRGDGLTSFQITDSQEPQTITLLVLSGLFFAVLVIFAVTLAQNSNLSTPNIQP